MDHGKHESAEHDSDDALVAKPATAIMMAVKATGVLEGADDAITAHATSIVHRELKALLKGEDAYRDALKGVADGTIHAAYAMVLVMATCTEKIVTFVEGGIELPPEDMREIRHDLGLSTDGMAKALRLGENGERTIRLYEAGELAPPGPVTLLYEAYEDGQLRPPASRPWRRRAEYPPRPPRAA